MSDTDRMDDIEVNIDLESILLKPFEKNARHAFKGWKSLALQHSWDEIVYKDIKRVFKYKEFKSDYQFIVDNEGELIQEIKQIRRNNKQKAIRNSSKSKKTIKTSKTSSSTRKSSSRSSRSTKRTKSIHVSTKPRVKTAARPRVSAKPSMNPQSQVISKPQSPPMHHVRRDDSFTNPCNMNPNYEAKHTYNAPQMVYRTAHPSNNAYVTYNNNNGYSIGYDRYNAQAQAHQNYNYYYDPNTCCYYNSNPTHQMYHQSTAPMAMQNGMNVYGDITDTLDSQNSQNSDGTISSLSANTSSSTSLSSVVDNV
eukprot:215346_1